MRTIRSGNRNSFTKKQSSDTLAPGIRGDAEQHQLRLVNNSAEQRKSARPGVARNQYSCTRHGKNTGTLRCRP